MISLLIISIIITPAYTLAQRTSSSSGMDLENQLINVEIAIILGDDSDEVEIAFNYVQDNIPEQHYVIVDNFKDARNYEILIIIAHGGQSGLQIGKSEISWDSIGLTIRDSSIMQVFTFACDGSFLLQYIPSDIKLISFKGSLDAKIGGLLATTAISLLRNLDIGYLVELLFERVKEIEDGQEIIELGKYYRAETKKIYVNFGFFRYHIDTNGNIDWLYTGSNVASWQFDMTVWSTLVGIANPILSFIVGTYAWWISTSSACNSGLNTQAISYGINSKYSRLTTDLHLNCANPYPYSFPTSIPLPILGILWIDIISLIDTNNLWWPMLN